MAAASGRFAHAPSHTSNMASRSFGASAEHETRSGSFSLATAAAGGDDVLAGNVRQRNSKVHFEDDAADSIAKEKNEQHVKNIADGRSSVSCGVTRRDEGAEGSAEDVLRNVRTKARQKAHRIGVLQTANEGLTSQVKESRALLVRAHQELQLKNEQIQTLADTNAKLLSSTKAEKERRLRLEQQLKLEGDQQTQRRLKDIKRVGEKVINDDAMQELTKEVKRARDELQDVYFENSRYRSEVQRLSDALKKAANEHDMHKDEWKDKAVELLSKLQQEEDRARAAAKEAAQLSSDVIKLGDENMKLDQQLSSQEEKIGTMIEELDRRNNELQRVRSTNEELNAKLQQSETAQNTASSELSKTSEQLRMMAEKVFHLIGRLRKMDEWKSQASDDLQSASKKIAVLEKRAEALQKLLDRDDKLRKKMELKVKDEKDKATSHRLAAQEFRRKFINEERIRAKLMEALKAKERLHAETLNKYKTAQWQLQGQRSSKTTRQHRINALEKQVRDLVSATSTLRNKIKGLEATHVRMQDALRSKDVELKNYRRREQQYIAKLAEHADAAKARAKALAASTADGAVEGVTIDETQLDALLNGSGGNVNKMLNALKMSESAFVQLSRRPAQLVRRLAERFCKVLPPTTTTTTTTTKRRPTKMNRSAIDAVYNRVDALKDEVRASNTNREALLDVVLRLLVPSLHANTPQSVPEGVRGRLLNSVRCVDLSQCSLGDEGAALVAGVLPCCPTLLVLDVSANAIGDEGFLTLSRVIAGNESRLELVGFADNFVTKSAVRSLVLGFRRHREIRATYVRRREEDAVHCPELVVLVNERSFVMDLRCNDITTEGLAEIVGILASGAQSTVNNDVFKSLETRSRAILALYRSKRSMTTTTTDVGTEESADTFSTEMAPARQRRAASRGRNRRDTMPVLRKNASELVSAPKPSLSSFMPSTRQRKMSRSSSLSSCYGLAPKRKSRGKTVHMVAATRAIAQRAETTLRQAVDGRAERRRRHQRHRCRSSINTDVDARDLQRDS